MGRRKKTTDPAEPEQTTTPDAQEVLETRREIIGNVSFIIDFITNVKSTLAEYRLLSPDGKDTTEKIANVHSYIIRRRAAINLGMDPEKPFVLDPNNAEHKQAVEDAEREYQEDLLRSCEMYCSAVYLLQGIQFNYIPPDQSRASSQKLAIIYFFSIHQDLDPASSSKLTKDHANELTDIFYRLDRYLATNQPIKETADDIQLIIDFINHEKLPKNKNTIDRLKKTIDKLKYPIDKASQQLFNMKPGEMKTLRMESSQDHQKGKEASITVMYEYDEIDNTSITMSRPLTHYDKRVFNAVANLKDQGHDTVTTAQILRFMGCKTENPNAEQKEKVLKSLEAMSVCRVTLDNTTEVKLYTRYERVTGTFNLLVTEICKGYINGLVVDDAVNIKELPKLFEFAKNRGQISTIPIKMLDTGLNQTPETLSIEDYLLQRIIRMNNDIKNKRTPIIKKIKFDTIYTECNITEKSKKSRAPGKIYKILQHFKENGLIEYFTMDYDEGYISFDKKKRNEKNF